MKTKTFKLTLLAGVMSTILSSGLYANSDTIIVETGTNQGNIEIASTNNAGKELHITNKGSIGRVKYYDDYSYSSSLISSYAGLYINNEKDATINQIDIPNTATKFEVENKGTISKFEYDHSLYSNNILESFKLDKREIKIKNADSGVIDDSFRVNSASSVVIENKGNINNFIEFGSFSLDANDSPQTVENLNVVNDNKINTLQFNALESHVINNKGAEISTLSVHTTNGKIVNEGKIGSLIISPIANYFAYYRSKGYEKLNFDAKWNFENEPDQNWGRDYLTNLVLQKILAEAQDKEYANTLTWDKLGKNATIEEKTEIFARLLGVENDKDKVAEKFNELLKQANEEIMSKYAPLEVHLEGGELKFLDIDRRDKFNIKDFDPNNPPPKLDDDNREDILSKSTPVSTKVFIDKDTKITGRVTTEGVNDTIVLVGTTDIDNKKFKGFTNLVVTKADWTLSDKDFKYSNTVKIEDSTVHLNKSSQVGNIESGTITNDKNSLILVETDYELNGDVVNEGKIHFVPDPNLAEDDANKNEPHTLTINGDYRGEGTIKMRVNVEKSPITNDKVIISETATGKTKIELANDPVGLKVRTKEKATLIEAKAEGSQANAFKLGRSRFGPYRYLLSSLKEDDKIKWILEQRFSGEIGNIVTALSNSQQLFTHTYYDRTGAAKNAQGVWVRLGHQRKESQIGSSDSTITSNSTLSHLQIGYDIDRFAFKNGQLSYGAYVNYGTDKTKTQFIGEPEIARSKLKGYGVGFYSSYLQDNWYLDGWLSYNKFSNKLFTEEGINKYDMKALQASAELGYQYNIPVGSQQLAIKPQWQLIYTYIPNFDVAGFDGLKAENRHYLTSRLGVRLNLETAYQFKPFVELNWIYNMKETAINLEDEKFKLEGNRHLKEVKVGFERLGLTKNTYLWGQVLGRFGTDKYREYAVQAGISYQF